MPEVDADLARHCLEDLGGRSCPIMSDRNAARAPSPACDGLSIRDTLFYFIVDAMDEQYKAHKKGRRRREAELSGQITALAYAVALIDNPYRPDAEAVTAAAKMEAKH